MVSSIGEEASGKSALVPRGGGSLPARARHGVSGLVVHRELTSEGVELAFDVYADAEDGTSVDETLCEEPEHGVRDLSGGRYDEARYGETCAGHEHGDCRCVLDVCLCFLFHISV